MIIANFTSRTSRITVDGGWQYDYGQQLQITGLTNLPSAPQVHFAKIGDITTESRIGSVVNNVLTVNIPNAMFTEIGFIAFVYIVGESTGKTQCSIKVQLRSREQPSDIVTSDQQSSWDENIAQLEAVIAAQEAIQINPPIQGESGYWLVYNATAEEYEETVYPWRGEQGEQGIQGTQGEHGENAYMSITGETLTVANATINGETLML